MDKELNFTSRDYILKYYISIIIDYILLITYFKTNTIGKYCLPNLYTPIRIYIPNELKLRGWWEHGK